MRSIAGPAAAVGLELHMSVVILNQAIIHYEALGRGRPVVFLHGWVGSWRYWISAMQVASNSYRTYALDLFGYGDTTHDPDSYSVEKQAGLLASFIGEMGMGKVALVGHGLGAWVAFFLAAEQPERVARVLAVSAPVESASINARLRAAGSTELVDWLSGRTPEALEALSDAPKADPRAVAVSMLGFQAEDLFSRFCGTNVPCLLVYGQNDPSLLVPLLDHSGSPGSNLHQVNLEDSGHFPMIESAGRFHRILTDFLALDAGLSPREMQVKEEWRRRVR
jgi:pimeloyl-ACP methyl ester carboxylesterase